MLEFIAAVIAGFIGGAITEWFMIRRHHYKFRWTCPICPSFSVEASSQDIVDRVKAIHIHEESQDAQEQQQES